MSIQDTNKSLAKRFVEEVFNRGNMDIYDELVADDYLNHNPPIAGLPGTKQGFRQAVVLTRQAFPDVHVGIEDTLAEGDRVMFRDTAKATHKADFQGIPATNKKLIWTEMHFFRIAESKIVEHSANFDQSGILVQLGVFPKE